MKKTVVIVLLTFLMNFISFSSANAEPAPGAELFIFHFGYFLPNFDTKLRVDNETFGKGSEVSVEDDLGLDSQETIFRGDITWRMSERNRLQVGFFRFGRDGEKEINRDVQIGDEIYPAGAILETSLKLTVIPISYFYSFLKNDDWEIAGGAGLQWSSIRFDVNGSASLGNSDSSDEARADADAPLPLLAFDLKYYIFPEWSVGTNLGAFVYKIGTSNMSFQGEILSAAINTDYWFSTYVGAGFAINWFSFNVDVDSAKWDGSFNYSYWGPQIYLSGRF